MNIGGHLVTVRGSEHWHSFPRQVVESLSLKSDWTVHQKMSGHDPGYPGLCNSA